MATKHYVIALQESFIPNIGLTTFGTVVSSHCEAMNARDKATKLSREKGFSERNAGFGVIQSDDRLEKGSVHEELAKRYVADKYDREAIYAMKGVIDPYWRGSTPVSDQETAWALEDLKISLPELQARYEDKARDELNRAQIDRISNAERRARIDAVQGQLAAERSQFTYTFPAVAGVQAGRSYYAAQVPYTALVKLFVFDDSDSVPAHLRAQRLLSEKRAEDIGEYLVANRGSYVLPALTASVSSEMSFEPVALPGAGGRIGLLHIPMDATLLINDGQHRRRGIELAVERCPSLREESIVVTIFFDQGLERSQQMFADINGRQVKPSSAINALYDRRDPFNAWVRSVMDMLPAIGSRIDVENSSVPAKSYKLWSLVAFKKSLSLLTGITPKNVTEADTATLQQIDAFLQTFFNECGRHVPKWAQMISGAIPAVDVREQFVIGHAVWLEALAVFARRALFTGHAGAHAGSADGIIRPEMAHWERMAALAKVDPRRESMMWENRCVVLGKMQKTTDGVKGTAAKLLSLANVSLPADMVPLEKRLDALLQEQLVKS